MSKGDARTKKEAYFTKLETLLNEYPSIFIVNVDNVGSNQMHQIRLALRGVGVILMGKNTMVRRVLRNLIAEGKTDYQKLMDAVKGNVGFVFTKGDLKEVRTKILSNRVAAPAKAGALAPVDVTVPAGNTGMEPGKTSFFQALGVPTKIARGTIEIVSDVHLIKAGNRVGASEAALLNMLNISPFTYGLTVVSVWDSNTLFAPSVLDIDESVFIDNLKSGIATVAAISLALNIPTAASIPYLEGNFIRELHKAIEKIAAISLAVKIPTAASVPHLLADGFKNIVSVGLETNLSFAAVDRIKNALANPTAAVAAAPVSSAPAAAAAPAAAKKEEVKEEEEEDDDMGFGLFD